VELDGDICGLCGGRRKLFQPTVLYCSGSCGQQKIRRNAKYYSDHSKTNHWCGSCYATMSETDLIVLDDGSEIRKKDLQQFKNDALPEEGWVQCDFCDSWVHQICALFNGRKNRTSSSYMCPKCDIAKRSSGELLVSGDNEQLKMAKDLPHCKMSETIEDGLRASLAKAYVERANELGVDLADVEKPDPLYVRVVSNMEKKHIVRDEVRFGR
jgi:E1A/CREB-binding protein